MSFRSTFGSASALSPADAPTAPGSWSRWDSLSLVALAFAVTIIASTQGDYGLTWDEPASIQYGRKILAFFHTWGKDRSAATDVPYLRGGTFHLLVEFLATLLPSQGLAVRRLVTAAVGLAGVVGAWAVARSLAGAAAAFLAVLLLLLTPSYYGHMFMNPADISFAAGYIWSLYVILTMHRKFPSVGPADFVSLGVIAGLTIGCRNTGVIVFFYHAVSWMVRWANDRWRGLPGWSASVVSRLIIGTAVAFVLSILLAIAFWPAALLDPVGILSSGLRSETSYLKHEEVLFQGRTVWSDALPREYWIVYSLVKLPIPLLALASAGLLLMASQTRHWLTTRSWYQVLGWWLVGISFVLPLAYATLRRPPDYDEIRHFLFILPPMAALAGIVASSAGTALARFGRSARMTRLIAALALAVALAQPCWSMIQLHPYQYTYYNQFVGGLRGASGRFLTDYWALSFAPAISQLVQYARGTTSVPGPGQPWRVRVCGPVPVTRRYLPPDFLIVGNKVPADFYLATTKWRCDERQAGRVISVIERSGVPFAVVKDLGASADQPFSHR